ncbi:MAG: hypothetical protein HZC17_05330 [Candidatus Omnitrophica bacterium]|nr:hypothetical protein [Candidatus Omnitrophota bacterium]
MTRKIFCLITVLFLSLITSNLLADSAKSVAGVTFSAPSAWKETQPSSSMRTYQFDIPGKANQNAELAVFYFGQGQGGNIQGNIERWKGQFTKLDSEQTNPKTINDLKVTEVLFQGTYQLSGGPMMMAQGDPVKDYALLGAIIEAPQGVVFLKMIGPKDTVNSSKSDFEALLNGLKKA